MFNDNDTIYFHGHDDPEAPREFVRLHPDGTAWVNPLVPMSPKAREGVQMLATYAASLTLAHRTWRDTMQGLLGNTQGEE